MKKIYISEAEKLATAAIEINAAKKRGQAAITTARRAITRDILFRHEHKMHQEGAIRQKNLEAVRKHLPLENNGWK